MISWIDRNNLEEENYNNCISNSKQSLMYGYSWYLDLVCDEWNALVWKDYQAVMPIPIRKKYGVSYVYPPLWVLQLGIFSQNDAIPEQEFIEFLSKKVRFVELRLNAKNAFLNQPVFQERNFQQLSLNHDYEWIYKNYQSDRKKDLKKAQKLGLQAKWSDRPENLIRLFQNNVGKRTPEIQERDYQNLSKLIHECMHRGKGEVLSIYHGEQLVASAFFVKHQQTITILCSSTDFSNRNNGGNTLLIDLAIQKYKTHYTILNFGGSSMKSIASYFFSFGAQQVSYPFLRQRKWPWFLRFLKV